MQNASVYSYRRHIFQKTELCSLQEESTLNHMAPLLYSTFLKMCNLATRCREVLKRKTLSAEAITAAAVSIMLLKPAATIA